jgi:hypothetical protein
MKGPLQQNPVSSPFPPPQADTGALSRPPMLSPYNAWRILCRRTGGTVSRATFYRWLNSGRVFSIRVGFRIFIPWPALDEFIQHCLEPDRD